MRYRTPLAIWAFLSPISWLIMLFIAAGNKTSNLGIAVAVGGLACFSLLGSFAAYILWSKSDHFFKSIETLEDEIKNALNARRMYTRKLEELELKSKP